MFSNEEIRDIYAVLPPAKSSDKHLPSLILAASGEGFITLHHILAEFEQRVSDAEERKPLSDLSRLLDVSDSLIVQLVRSHASLTLLSHDRSHVLPKAELGALQRKIHDALSSKLTSKKDLSQDIDVDTESLEILLRSEDSVIECDGHVCSQTYHKALTDSILDLIERAIANITIVYIHLRDTDQLPGSPPMWFVSRCFHQVIDLHNLGEKAFIRETPTLIQCHSAEAKEHNIKAQTGRLLSGEDAFLDLNDVLNALSDMFQSLEEVDSSFSNTEGVEVVAHCAISARWIKDYAHKSLQRLHYDGAVNVTRQLREVFPQVVLSYVAHQAEQSILAASAGDSSSDSKLHQFRNFILTKEKYETEKEATFASAKEAGATEWRSLTNNHDYVLKFDSTNISSANTVRHEIQQALLQERSIEKAAEEHFWTTISSHEAQNEAEFATYWTERITTRIQIYTSALAAIEDPRLQIQLSDLLATNIKKDLVPDSMARARTQGLVLSRKTRKNTQKFEATLQTTATEVPAILNTIEKFNKKQGIEAPSPQILEDGKQAMFRDMLRRMQKHQKSSDGPVIFLTLVIVLFAKYHDGVVYATGKYAPKLLKQLKGKLEVEQYEQVEKWKEAAKAGTLAAEDREEMRKMANV